MKKNNKIVVVLERWWRIPFACLHITATQAEYTIIMYLTFEYQMSNIPKKYIMWNEKQYIAIAFGVTYRYTIPTMYFTQVGVSRVGVAVLVTLRDMWDNTLYRLLFYALRMKYVWSDFSSPIDIIFLAVAWWHDWKKIHYS